MKKLLDAATATGAGISIQLPSPSSVHGLEIYLGSAGTLSALTVDLQGSIGGKFWQSLSETVATATNLTAGGIVIFVADKPVEHIRAKISNYSSGYASMGTIEASGGAPASGTTVTIGTKIYKFATTCTASMAEGIVKSGSAAASGIAHLRLAMIHGAGSGVKYVSAASHDSCTCGTLTSSTLVIRARAKGTAGDSIVLSETSGSLTATGSGFLHEGVDLGEVSAYYTPYPNL